MSIACATLFVHGQAMPLACRVAAIAACGICPCFPATPVCSQDMPAPASQHERDLDTRTRPFANGQFRCFINASLQALFARARLRECLRQRLATESEDVVAASMRCCDLGPNLPKKDVMASTEMLLACTLHVASSTEERNKGMRPSLILRCFYRHRQEDAHDFLLHVLGTDTRNPFAISLRSIQTPALICASRRTEEM